MQLGLCHRSGNAGNGVQNMAVYLRMLIVGYLELENSRIRLLHLRKYKKKISLITRLKLCSEERVIRFR